MDFTVFLAQEWMLVSVLVALIVALMVTESRRGGSSLSHHEVTRMLNNKEAVLLDVRESSEYKTGHIASAINIPFTKLPNRTDELSKHKDKTIVVIDKLGQHAGSCAGQLKQKGYQVSRLKGGMTEWTSQNLPVVKA